MCIYMYVYVMTRCTIYLSVTADNVALYIQYVHMQVSTNGYFSMDKPPENTTLHNIPGPDTYSVVAPFAADIDTSKTGTVKYTKVTFDYTEMSVVSAFIRDETGDFFFGSKMIAAEWDHVPMKKGSSVCFIIRIWYLNLYIFIS